MTETLTRRTALKAGIWAVPVVAVAVATPLAAASEVPQTRTRIEFTNATATEGGSKQIPWNTKIQEVNGVPVTNVYVSVTLKRESVQIAKVEKFFPSLGGNGNTNIIQGVFEGLELGNGSPYVVEFFASADNADAIQASKSLTPPDWWKW